MGELQLLLENLLMEVIRRRQGLQELLTDDGPKKKKTKQNQHNKSLSSIPVKVKKSARPRPTPAPVFPCVRPVTIKVEHVEER